MSMQHKIFIIPDRLLLDKAVPAGAKLLYGELFRFSKQDYCIAVETDEMCDIFKVKPKTIHRWFSRLAAAGYIRYIVSDESATSRKVWFV